MKERTTHTHRARESEREWERERNDFINIIITSFENLRKETIVGEHGSHLHSYHCRFLFGKQNSNNWKPDCAGYGDGSSSSAEQHSSRRATTRGTGKTRGFFFFLFFFGAKYYFSIINFWEINFAVSGDSARVGHLARLGQSSDTRLLRVPTGQRLSPNWRG